MHKIFITRAEKGKLPVLYLLTGHVENVYQTSSNYLKGMAALVFWGFFFGGEVLAFSRVFHLYRANCSLKMGEICRLVT